MPISIENLESLILESFPNAKITIEDLKGDGDHYSATIICSDLKNKSKVKQHQMVYNALKGKMGSELHALMLKTIAE